METRYLDNDTMIAGAYRENYLKVLGYIRTRVNDEADAENLSQDVWLRVLECGYRLSADTLMPYIYTVARNLVNDYLRRLYRSRNVAETMAVDWTEESDYLLESEIVAKDIAEFERRRVECLPPQRRIIYVLSRYEEKSVDDIAVMLSLSVRTVENHLRLGRHDVRGFIAGAIA